MSSLVFTEQGWCYTAVADRGGSGTLWVRSQDRASMLGLQRTLRRLYPDYAADFRFTSNPDHDYQFRMQVWPAEWGQFLADRAVSIEAYKVKPTIAEARGYTHPVARAVEGVFYFLSRNRPDGSEPAWLKVRRPELTARQR